MADGTDEKIDVISPHPHWLANSLCTAHPWRECEKPERSTGHPPTRLRRRQRPSDKMTAQRFSVPRTTVVVVTTLVIFMPLGLIFWQSFLNAPFFNPAHRFGFGAYAFIFED